MATAPANLHTFGVMPEFIPINPGQDRVRRRGGATDADLATRFERDVIPLCEQLYHGARRLTQRDVDAEDLMQETMLRAYAEFGSFHPGTHLKAWLSRIMRNVWINTYRKALVRPVEHLGVEMTDWERMKHGRIAATTSRSAEVEALNGSTDPRIVHAFAALPQDLRVVVYYAHVEGFRYREIAEIMGTPIGTVMSRLHRARNILRPLLTDVARQRGFNSLEITNGKAV